MENNTEDTPRRRRSNPRPALVTLQGWADVCKTGKTGTRASAAWLEHQQNSNNPRPNAPLSFPAGRDKRRWDYRRYGYADKPCLPRDTSKSISSELQRFYGDEAEAERKMMEFRKVITRK